MLRSFHTDVGTDKLAHLEMMTQFDMPNWELFRATQSPRLCYAGRNTRSFNKGKAHLQNRIDSVVRSV